MREAVIFLVTGPHSWGGVWQRPHHLFRLLAQEYPCYYVATRYFLDAWRKRSEYLRGRSLLQPAKNLFAREILLLNGERLPFIRAYNIRHLSFVLHKFLHLHPAAKKILWLYDPHQVKIIDLVPHDLLVYDIMDEYSGFPWSPPNVAEEEKELLARADVVIAGTYSLYENKRPLVKGGKIDWILSGVDFEHFHLPGSKGELPLEIKKIKEEFRYLAGYYGVVDMRIDVELIRQAAEKLSDWAFAFIGPLVGREVLRLKRAGLKNLFFLGSRHYSALPIYARGFDICLIPFVLDRLTLHINPTKILEYFALGKPVVSAAIPDIKRFYSEVALIYERRDDFISALQRSVSSPQIPPRIERGIALAYAASWSSAVEKIKKLLFAPQ